MQLPQHPRLQLFRIGLLLVVFGLFMWLLGYPWPMGLVGLVLVSGYFADDRVVGWMFGTGGGQ